MYKRLLLLGMGPALLCAMPSIAVALPTMESVGKAIFFDTNLSTPPGQSCASCHDPTAGFADPDHEAVSPGALRGRFGNRNAPMAAYASFIPPFGYDSMIEAHTGGQFWDGRASTLEEQAEGPFLNPLEMNMPNKQSVVSRVADSAYADDFRAVFGPKSLSPKNVDAAYALITAAIAAYERTDEVNPFSSKHDYAMKLTGGARMQMFTMQERQGMMLFNGKARCWVCHVTPMGGMGDGMMGGGSGGGGMGGGGMGSIPDQLILFSDYRYANLGIPANPDNPFYDLPETLNPEGEQWIDHGLASVMPGGVAGNPELDGLFKTPSLRNVALTAPYGHNGYFQTLKEIVHFYNTRDVPGAGWPEPEVSANIDTEEMGDLGLTDAEEEAIVAFLHTLSDGWWDPLSP
jgi:cytochrome c peroxidase